MKKYIALTVFLALSAFGYAQSDSAANYPFLTSPGYEKMRAETLKVNLPKVLVVMASFEGCAPCKMAKTKFLPEVKKSISSYANVEFYVLDIMEDKEPNSEGKFLGERWNLGTRYPVFLVVDMLADSNDEVKYRHGYVDSDNGRRDLLKGIMDAVKRFK